MPNLNEIVFATRQTDINILFSWVPSKNGGQNYLLFIFLYLKTTPFFQSDINHLIKFRKELFY